MSSAKKHSTPFQPGHCLEYGLSIMAYGLKKEVTSVQCDFCFYNGRNGDDTGRKRSRGTDNLQLFTPPPYCPELYCKHLEGQHAVQWLEYYKSMSKPSKMSYFISKKEAAMPSISSIFEPKGVDREHLKLTIARRHIVDDLYWNLVLPSRR